MNEEKEKKTCSKCGMDMTLRVRARDPDNDCCVPVVMR